MKIKNIKNIINAYCGNKIELKEEMFNELVNEIKN